MDSSQSSCRRAFLLLLRNFLFLGVAYTLVTTIIHLSHLHYIYSPSTPLESLPSPNPARGTLRPESLVTPEDDYLGPRPHADTYANFTRLIEVCRGSLSGLEKMRNVYDCLKYLAEKEQDYYFIPDNGTDSSTDGPAIGETELPTQSSIGQCPGPIIPYHTYWTGPATWRVELFIKAYLHTQNLACSRLYLWLDADAHPTAVADMLQDALFSNLLPLVKRGDIILREWKFPSKIPIPASPENVDPWYAEAVPDPSTGVTIIGDVVIREPDRSEWVVLTPRQLTFLPVAVSDAVRFIVLHLWGGLYCDMDVVMLRDFRPLLLPPNHAFAERWAVHTHPGDYNTAIMSLVANSSLSSYLLRGGVRMGVNFHPRVIGRMAWKDSRNEEFAMFETGLFDPIWGEFNWGREGKCAIPCLRDYSAVFIGEGKKVKASGEWESWDGKQLEIVYQSGDRTAAKFGKRKYTQRPQMRTQAPHIPASETSSSAFKTEEETYDITTDPYPPNNRTLSNFFRGAYSYHIHNQVSWSTNNPLQISTYTVFLIYQQRMDVDMSVHLQWRKYPQPNSWLDIIMKAQDGFFARKRRNPYGEMWAGPEVTPYKTYPELS